MEMDAYTSTNRSMEVDYDDIVIMPGNPERVGRVASFIWNDHQGYKMPDEMDIGTLNTLKMEDRCWRKSAYPTTSG